MLRPLEHPPRLRRGEANAFAERVHCINQPLGMQRSHPFILRINILIGTAIKLGWQGMRGQIGSAHSDLQCLPNAPRYAQHARLVMLCKPVAGFDF